MKTCPFCAESIQDAAIVCRYCSRALVAGASARAVSPGVAAVLSLVIPGAGTMYAGKIGGGLVWLVVVALAYVLLLPIGLVLHLVAVVVAAGDARDANRPPAGPVVAPGGQVARVDGACPTCGTPLAADAYFCPVCRGTDRA